MHEARSLCDEIARMKVVCDKLEINSVLDSEKAYAQVSAEILNCQMKSVHIGRIISMLRYAKTKSGMHFNKVSDNDIIRLLTEKIEPIMTFVDPRAVQAISRNLYIIFRQPEMLAEKFIAYLISPNCSVNVSALANSTFTTLFCNFSSFEYVSAGASMLLRMMSIPRGMEFVGSFIEPFLWSMHTFYDTLWYNFKQIWLEKMIHRNKASVFKALELSLKKSRNLVEWGYCEVIKEFCRHEPVTRRLLLMNKVIIYKSAKLYFKHNPMFIEHEYVCSQALAYLKTLCRLPVKAQAELVVSIITSDFSPINSTPCLVDAARMVHLPLLVTEFDVVHYSHIVCTPQQQQLFAEYERNQRNLCATIFRPFSVQYYYNRNYFKYKEECPIIDCEHFDIKKCFFTDAEWELYETEWKLSQGSPVLHKWPKNFELFVLYKRAEKMNEKVNHMNQVFGMIQQKNLMLDYQKALKRTQNMILSKFYMHGLKTFVPDNKRPMGSIRVGCAFLVRIENVKYQDRLILPFLVQLLNKLDLGCLPGHLRGMYKTARLNMAKRIQDADNRWITSCEKPIVKLPMWAGDPPLKIGDRFNHLLAFIKDVETFVRALCEGSPDIIDDRIIQFYGFLFVTSGNDKILETLVFINYVFINTEFRTLLTGKFMCKWTRMMQALWYLAAANQELAVKCRDLAFP